MGSQMFQIPKKLSNYDISCNAIGIDFGTKECCAAVIRKNGPEFVVLDPTTQLRTMPSFIVYDEIIPKGGQVVVDRMRHKAEHTVYDIKRIIGKNFDDIVVDSVWPFNVIQRKGNDTFIDDETHNGKVQMESVQVVGDLLKYIKNTLKGFQKQIITNVVISVTLEISDSQQSATEMAAEHAGWKNIHFFPEPDAAAFAYFQICNLGGGSVRICVAKIGNGNLKVLIYTYFSIKSFNKLSFDHFALILQKEHYANHVQDKKNCISKPECQNVKHNLCATSGSWLYDGEFDTYSDEIKITPQLEPKDTFLKIINKSPNLLNHEKKFVFQGLRKYRMPVIENKDVIFPACYQTKQESSIYPNRIFAQDTGSIENRLAVNLSSSSYDPAPYFVYRSIGQFPVKHVALNKEENFIIPAKRRIYVDMNCVGVDLGVSRCCGAVMRKWEIATVPLDNTGERTLPSYVSYDEKYVKCGKVVVNRLKYHSKSTIYDSKKIIGKNIEDIEIDPSWPFKIKSINGKVFLEIHKFDGKGCFTSEEVTSDLLKYIKQKSQEFQGKKLSKVIITVPLAFTVKQKAGIMEAAKLAGWNEIAFLPEPVAAAFAYFIDRPISRNSNVLLVDFGGGTLDVCIFKVENKQIQLLSNIDDSTTAGKNFDIILFNYFKNALYTKYNIPLIQNKRYLLIAKCQEIKETLSVQESATLDIDYFDPNQEGRIRISRYEFEEMAESLLQKVETTIHSALCYGNYLTRNINIVMYAGSGSRMPMIKQLLQKIFPIAEHRCAEHPDEVVAIGAAYYGNNSYFL